MTSFHLTDKYPTQTSNTKKSQNRKKPLDIFIFITHIISIYFFIFIDGYTKKYLAISTKLFSDRSHIIVFAVLAFLYTDSL